MPLTIRSRQTSPRFFEIELEGRLDSDTFRQLDELLDSMFKGEVRGVRYDLAGLVYISSRGLSMFIKTANLLKANRGGDSRQASLVLMNLQPQVKKIFQMANILLDMMLCETEEEADRYFEVIQKREVEDS
jgi:anti-sigma B factor antagonist